MDYTDTAEQAALREVVRDFCERHAGPSAWPRLTSELGLAGLAIDESHGGAGATLAEVAIAVEELARVLLPVPYLSTALAGAVLSAAPADAGLLPGLASGKLAAAFAFGDSVMVTDGHLDGVATHVLDGAEAGVFLVSAGGSLHAVRAADTAVTPAGTLDLTRSQATVEFRRSRAVDTGADPGHAEDLLRVLLAAESAAAAGYCLEVTVHYLKTRQQFGRPIGTFQALRHRCADLAVEVSSARATAWAALAADDVSVLGPLAKKYCADVFWHVAAEMIQLHGGIGFTWEHQAHRYLKRAKTTQLLHGSPAQLRRLVAERAGLT
jgi:alkylation response protein AidB-like acyl-CoA dehydrogenase